MSESGPDLMRDHGWLYDHIGRIAGAVLGLLAIGFLCLLAAVGYGPALGILVFVVVFVGLIALGGKMRSH